ncbi:MAG TPA: hypothetical protein VEK34_08915 [Methylocella sp.]|nr:hypothetical protein [Methylocella sp.]
MPTSRTSPLRLRLTDANVLLIFTCALFALSLAQRYFSVILQPGLWTEYGASITHEVNAGELLAFLAIVSVLGTARETPRLSKTDLAILSACSLLFLSSKESLPFVGATLAGLYFWRRYPSSQDLSSVGQLWLAISIYRVWGRLIFKIVSAPIVAAEALIIAKAGQWMGYDLTLDGLRINAPSGWFVYILEGCSSFHNISLAGLLWLSLLKLGGARVDRSKIFALGIGVFFIICLNATRILLMTPSEEAYHYWHEGSGAAYFSCATLIAIAAPTLFSLRSKRS